MVKTWQKMTQAEKIEDLRKDVKSIFKHLKEIQSVQKSTIARLEGVSSLLSEVAVAIKKLEIPS